MYYDRFDIVEAYYIYYLHHHEGQWSDSYARLCKILTYFKPRPSLNDPFDLSENGFEIYKHIGEGK